MREEHCQEQDLTPSICTQDMLQKLCLKVTEDQGLPSPSTPCMGSRTALRCAQLPQCQATAPPRGGTALLLHSTACRAQEALEGKYKGAFWQKSHVSFRHQQHTMGGSEVGSGCGSARSDSSRDPDVLTCVVVPGSNLFWGDSIERLTESTGLGLVTSLWSLEEVPVPDTP